MAVSLQLMIAREVSYEGRVQGVGFRYSVRELAKGFEVVGTVQNLPDGRVLVRAQGEEAEVKEFLKAIGDSHLRAHITRHIVREESPVEGKKGFKIQA